MGIKSTTAEFISKASRVHNCFYSYGESQYEGIDTKLSIECPIHGLFMQSPYNHVNRQSGCSRCGDAKAAKAKHSNIAEFVSKASVIHEGKYTYNNAVYIEAKAKITITCPAHGDFAQLVSGHLSGYGCRLCASHGKGRVDPAAKCKLYYLHIKNTSFYKVGITTQSIENRYRSSFDRDQFDVVWVEEFSTGQEAYNKEQEIHKMYSKYKYKGPAILNSGNTEIFTKDILGLYKESK